MTTKAKRRTKARRTAPPSPPQVHVSGARGYVVLHVGTKSVALSPDQADRVALELVRKADVSRLVYRLATGMVR